jgi:hypothetical protein
MLLIIWCNVVLWTNSYVRSQLLEPATVFGPREIHNCKQGMYFHQKPICAVVRATNECLAGLLVARKQVFGNLQKVFFNAGNFKEKTQHGIAIPYSAF